MSIKVVRRLLHMGRQANMATHWAHFALGLSLKERDAWPGYGADQVCKSSQYNDENPTGAQCAYYFQRVS